jgi:hypothetical protein
VRSLYFKIVSASFRSHFCLLKLQHLLTCMFTDVAIYYYYYYYYACLVFCSCIFVLFSVAFVSVLAVQ